VAADKHVNFVRVPDERDAYERKHARRGVAVATIAFGLVAIALLFMILMAVLTIASWLRE
jgi:hypothetical protein